MVGKPSRGAIPGAARSGIFGSGYSTALTGLKLAGTDVSDWFDIGRLDRYWFVPFDIQHSWRGVLISLWVHSWLTNTETHTQPQQVDYQSNVNIFRRHVTNWVPAEMATSSRDNNPEKRKVRSLSLYDILTVTPGVRQRCEKRQGEVQSLVPTSQCQKWPQVTFLGSPFKPWDKQIYPL